MNCFLPLALARIRSHTGGMYHYKEETQSVTRACEHPGCAATAEHRAPKDRGDRPEYYWFCLGHAREYNRQWDYFSGMSAEEIEHFQKEAMLGHRPTWNYQMRTQMHPHVLHEKLRRFMGASPAEPAATPPVLPRHRRALQTLALAHPADKKSIKAHYKKLVKQYHPDVNQGDKAAEDRFKRISEAYRLLLGEYAPE